MSVIKYVAPKSVQGYLRSEKFISLIIGPLGSGKTSASIFKILYHAARMRKQADGIRRSRCVVIRNTRGQLADTTIPSVQTWFSPDIATFMKTEMKMLIKVGDIECELLYRGLDDTADIRKLLSLEVSFAFLDEFKEIPSQLFEAVQGRVGRYPSMANGGCVTDSGKPNHHVFGSSNPPDISTYWEEFLTNPPANTDVFFQPSGLSPEADWLDNLIEDYYENLVQGKHEDWVDVFVHARFGKSLSGRPVHRAFDAAVHVAKQTLNPIRHSTNPLIIGHDYGLTPACTISQVDPMGRLITYADLVSEGMGILRFSREKLKPLLAQRFAGIPVIIIGDPAGNQRAQTDERSVHDILKQEGFRVVAAKTNSIVARINAVDSWLTRLTDGKPAHIIDPGCTNLITALRSGYRYKLKKDGEVQDVPDKNQWSHICFTAGTKILTPRGEVPIESLAPGNEVMTPLGPRQVLRAGVTQHEATVVEASFSNGRAFTCTPDHPVFVFETGFLPVDTLQYADLLVFSEKPCQTAALINTPSRSSKGLSTTTNPAATTKPTTPSGAPTCTALYGNSITARFQRSIRSTISTTTAAITGSKIWRKSIDAIMRGITSTIAELLNLSYSRAGSMPHEYWRQNGTALPRVVNGIPRTPSNAGKVWNRPPTNACTAARTTVVSHPKNAGSAPQTVSLLRGVKAEKTMWIGPVSSAVAHSGLGNTARLQVAPGHAVVKSLPQKETVYALTVEDCPMYFAEGVLVSNCDAHQYACLHADGNLGGGAWKTAAKPVEKKKWMWA